MSKHKEWIDYFTTMLQLNARIELRSRENRRNFDPIYFGLTNISGHQKVGYVKDTYYENYERFTPVELHKIKSYPEFINENTI